MEDMIEEDSKERRLFEKVLLSDISMALSIAVERLRVLATRIGTVNVDIRILQCEHDSGEEPDVICAVEDFKAQVAAKDSPLLSNGRLSKSIMHASSVVVTYPTPEDVQRTTAGSSNCKSADGGDEDDREGCEIRSSGIKVQDSRMLKKRKDKMDFLDGGSHTTLPRQTTTSSTTCHT